MDPLIKSISSSSSNIRQDVFPLDKWTITTRKGIILQSKCTCQQTRDQTTEKPEMSVELCNICKYHRSLNHLHNMPDMVFNDNLLKLEHFSGVGIEFNALDALKLVEETKDPLQVAVAGGWQSARADFPFAKSVVKPFDWTFTTNYRGTLLSAIKKSKQRTYTGPASSLPGAKTEASSSCQVDGFQTMSGENALSNDIRLCIKVEETDERIDVNKLKVRDEILFYDDITLYEDELADHGTAQYSVKVRVMPKCLFILARYYLRIDGVLARINDTRIYHELNKRYLLREYTNREAKLNSLNLPVSVLVNPNELMSSLPVIQSTYEKLTLPQLH